MQSVTQRAILAAAVLAFCGWLLYPPAQTLNLGLDLAGGTSLLYEVTVPEGANAEDTVQRTIQVLRDRVDPNGVRNLVWRVEAGNRIEIQMPRPSPQIEQRRTAFESARQRLLDGNISMSAVASAVQKSGAEREAALAALVKGVDGRLPMLQAAAGRYDELTAARAEYEQVKNDADKRIDIAAKVAVAELAYDRALEAVRATNLDLEAVARVAELPSAEARDSAGAAIPGSSPRAQALQRLDAQHPGRKADIGAFVAAYDQYYADKRPLEDPADLVRLLKGAGDLEFRITVTPQEVPDVTTLLDTLAQRGPQFAGTEQMKWFEIEDPVKFFNDRARVESLRDRVRRQPDAAAGLREGLSFFTAQGYVGTVFGDKFYMLLWDTQERSITRVRDEGWGISRVGYGQDNLGRPAVAVTLNTLGGSYMRGMSQGNVKRQMSIVLDGRVYSAPVINEPLGSSFIISGGSDGFSPAELNYLINTLAAGTLDAYLSPEPVQVRTFGPTIGRDNLEHGLKAAYVSFVIVICFMLVYYFFCGFVAGMALMANLLVTLGIMAGLHATFTLPGIAGVVLTIGMCVDANVLIYERIREEVRAGNDPFAALRLGYEKALSSIVDGNLTSLIVCVVLGYTASAEIKGFAVVLGIGILANLFTGVFLTRIVFDLYARVTGRLNVMQLPLKFDAIERALTPTIRWVSLRKGFYTLSIVLVVASLLMVFSRGSNMLDIEFRAGTEVAFDLASRPGPDGQPQPMTLTLDEARRRVREAATRSEAVKGLATANVVNLGDDLTGNHGYGSFTVVTTDIDEQAVADAILAAFADVLDAKPGLTFRQLELERRVETVDKQLSDAREKLRQAEQDQDAALTAQLKTQIEQLEPQLVEARRALNQFLYPVTDRDLSKVVNRPDLSFDAVDYLGGAAIVIDQINPPVTLEEVTQRIAAIRLQPDYEAVQYRPFEVAGIPAADNPPGKYTGVVIVAKDNRVNYFDHPQRWETELAASQWRLVRDAMQRQTTLSKVSNFTPTVAKTIRDNAIYALGLSVLGIIAYIWFRFGSLRYGLAAIIAVVHDVLITLGALALCGIPAIADSAFGQAMMLSPFRIDMGILAALLTIIGYSLNDTIVTFDRIRENRGKLATANEAIIDRSINQVFSRTILTVTTTFIAVLALYLLGGSGIHGFAFCLVIGLIVGTYSSVAIAAPMLLIGAGPDSLRPAYSKKPELEEAAATGTPA